ncbi:MarR family winged helix-turn-helix transcriptional regulator [Priestia koreensis]|uniref:MarR family winged helix-turn-helix transcriptional regulator n=1 Tax=Priestia koreensis TaxID=284581 RepID=UPI001F575C6A|nr:MarR family transcriptional regulator [Priestia koreensis]UNL85829.1 MarR family transcriptional regulator [Priestia koreensis]
MSKRHDLIVDVERLLRIVFRQLRQEVNGVLESELSINEFMTLRMLVEGGPQKVTDVSKHLKVAPSHVTAITELMLSKGWVERQRSDTDRRIVEIVVLPEGEAVFRDFEERKRAYFFERFQDFTNEELTIILTLFRKLDRTTISQEE